MRSDYWEELQEIRDELVGMAGLVAEALREASAALFETDLARAETVIAADHRLDLKQRRLDERIVAVLARESPVATDLRFLVAALGMSTTLERMGDLAKLIATQVRRRHPDPVLTEDEVPIFRQMATLTGDMIEKSRGVIQTHDLTVAAQVTKRDRSVDALLDDAFAMMERPEWDESTERTIAITLLARFYERLGDHAVSLCRRIDYLVTGEGRDPSPPESDLAHA